MAEEEALIPELTKRKMWCPECGEFTWHVYEGPVMYYSNWRCLVCGRVILGEPLHPGRKPPLR